MESIAPKQDVKKKRKKQKRMKRSSDYDELCLQYQCTRDWLSKRNGHVSVRLTVSELQLLRKQFAPRNNDRKVGGIDVDKASKAVVKHGIFEDELEAAMFLAKVDSNVKDDASSCYELQEGEAKDKDYVQIMLLKRFIHSFKTSECKRHANMKQEAGKANYLSSAKNNKKTEIVDEKDRRTRTSENLRDVKILNAVVKVPLAGGGVMFSHLSTPSSVVANKKDRLEELRSAAKIPNSNSIRYDSVFLAPGTDLIEHHKTLCQKKQLANADLNTVAKKPSLRHGFKFSKMRMLRQRSFNSAKTRNDGVSWSDAATKVTSQNSQRKLLRGASATTIEPLDPIKFIVKRMNTATNVEDSAPRRSMSAFPLPLRREKTSLGFVH